MERLPKILSIIAGAFILLLAATVYVGIRALRTFLPTTSLQLPAELETAKVTKGAGIFQKDLYFVDAQLGAVTDLRYQELDPGNPNLVVVGTGGAVFLREDKSVKERVSFPANLARESVALVESADAASPFFLSGGSWAAPATFFDRSGKELWTYGGSPGVDSAAAGDVDGDGKIEVAVGMNGSAGILLLDANGKQIWSKADGNVWHVEVLGGSGGVPGRILHSNARGKLVVRDSSGNVVERRQLDMYLSHFGLTRWNDEPKPTHVVASDSDAVYVYTSAGEPTAHFEAPAPILYDQIRAVLLLLSDGRTYLAVLRNYGVWNRAVLTIDSVKGETGSLVYREILGDVCESLTPLPHKDNQVLLVGCQGRVWQYDVSLSH